MSRHRSKHFMQIQERLGGKYHGKTNRIFRVCKTRQVRQISPKDRIKNFNEFHTPLSLEKQRQQGGRCMDCGVPFCQSGMMLVGMTSGCPLHNLVPEWNDCVYTGNWRRPMTGCHKTNNFPEFTSRVCPALCEAACTCGLNGDPVSTKENELCHH